MKCYLKFKEFNPTDDLRQNFFRLLINKTDKIDSTNAFSWFENERDIELFMGKGCEKNIEEIINDFRNYQLNQKKTLWVNFQKPIDLTQCFLADDDRNYAKLTYLSFDNLNYKGNMFKTDNSLTITTEFNPQLDKRFANHFRNDPRLTVSVEDYKKYMEILGEFDSIKKKCDHLYITCADDLVGYIAGLKLSPDLYGRSFYVIALIWIHSDIRQNFKKPIIYKIINYLNGKAPPYYAAIHYSNMQSRNFFKLNNFKPYIIRYLTWPE